MDDSDRWRPDRDPSLPVSDLDLSVRATNCLDAEGIRTIGELCRLTRREALSLRTLGRVTLAEIEEKLAQRGLSLRRDERA